ncbi:hypothetical protein [Streptomyces luteolus]|uniref:MarR family transcriptional regulator n=1 Tax=Streptomyces luteolus TaxID=3043615 RepID=A0ABT6T4Y3_9ACTN|nr:hypothetical protein [Streptomyces sp. B-S-A12]MDI3422931.1 hypothetical protein [Streptomyces sp. B-S-A12]
MPDGADVSIKGLAAQLPRGQASIGTALRELSRAGHLRRIRERVATEGASRWVTYTHFSRKAHGDEWWSAYVEGRDVNSCPQEPRGEEADSGEPAAPEDPVPEDPVLPAVPSAPPAPTEAYALLAELGLADSRMSLSAADCAALAPLAEEWLRRGSTRDRITHALTSGLPPEVHSPRRIAEIRLTDKLPPVLPPRRPTIRMLECTICRVPGRAEALRGGECAACRGDRPPQHTAPLRPETVRHYAEEARRAAKAPTPTACGRIPQLSGQRHELVLRSPFDGRPRQPQPPSQ